MIKEISNLGFMSLLGSPMLFKLVPKNAIGNVAKKMADHYLRSGRFLHEAMQDATEETFVALRLGLRPTLVARMAASRYRKEFVAQFQVNYLTPFLEARPELDEEEFRKNSAALCKTILKNLDSLVEDLAPSEEDAHKIFSELSQTRSDQALRSSQAQIFEKLRGLEGMSDSFMGMLAFKHLLVQAIHYFFKQRIAREPEVKAMVDELNQLQLKQDMQTSLQQQNVMFQNMQELLELVRNGQVPGDAANAWGSYNQGLQGFEQNMSRSLRELHLELRSEADKTRREIAREVREEHERTRREMRQGMAQILNELQALRREGSLQQEDWHSQQKVQRVRNLMTHAGIPQSEIRQLTKAPPRIPGGAAAPAPKAPHAVFEMVGQQAQEARRFIVYFAEELKAGRNSQSDLVTYWYPLPDPPGKDNPQWLNWQHSGQCHPSLNLSGHHLDLLWNGQGLSVRDRSSKGTWLGNQRLPQHQAVPLKDGDVLNLAGVLRLSYTRLENEDGLTTGWRLRRLNNAPGQEEYLFLTDGGNFSMGASRDDALAVSAKGLRPRNLYLKRRGRQLFVEAGRDNVLMNGVPLETETVLQSGTRLKVGETVFWCFPPESR